MTIDARQFARKATYVGPSPVTIVRDNTDVSIANTTSETALFTYTIPAGTLDGDHGVRVTIQGQAQNNAIANPLVTTIAVTLGATVLITGTREIYAATPGIYNWAMTLEVLAKNSDAVQEMFGTFVSGANASPHNYGASQSVNAFYGEATEDGTTDLDLVVSVEMDTANADCWWSHQRSIVELL